MTAKVFLRGAALISFSALQVGCGDSRCKDGVAELAARYEECGAEFVAPTYAFDDGECTDAVGDAYERSVACAKSASCESIRDGSWTATCSPPP